MKDTNGWDEWLPYEECKDPGLKAIHFSRYIFASQYCRGKTILDAGCGGGDGSKYLSEYAESVIAVDVSAEAVDYATSHYHAPNLEYKIGDVEHLEFDDCSFDVVVSFEVIEHLKQPLVYLQEIVRVLKPAGVFIVSTPNAPQHIDSPDFPFHQQEFTRHELDAMLHGCFGEVKLFGQGYKERNASRIWFLLRKLDVLKLRKFVPYGLRYKMTSRLLPKPLHEVSMDDIEIADDNLDLALNLIAVSSKPNNAKLCSENSCS
jgi:SAM-dependent methyltransferase